MKGYFLNNTISNILNSKVYYALEMWLCEEPNYCLENFVPKHHAKSHFTFKEEDGRLSLNSSLWRNVHEACG
jgi:hypothetical protein